eukprot:CAMPEP_0201579852 /NCGR_PEP_ID=MMETSP0190_2-20130828/27743_1 /ASSEMBLY_ACC=CAM_ASM_000263 /TAXON_ID=37353 /ORGANISM="Rosalina sp." /LENGTH=534 /DNA_ID=CAMNT_0048014889 /DNA_START=48 /DNA_END=1652 /DNA_ORIENTATION=+
MAVHQKHPSIVALSAKKRVKQFKQLFNNSNNTTKTKSKSNSSSYSTKSKPKHKSNDSILELKRRGLVNGGLHYQSQCDALNADVLNLTTTNNNNTPKKSRSNKTKRKGKSKGSTTGKCKSTSSTPKATKSRTKGKVKNKSQTQKGSRPTPPICPIGPINPINPINSHTMYGTNCMLSIIPQPIHCRALPTWLEGSDDDEFTHYTDYSDDTDLDNNNINDHSQCMSMSSSDTTICDEDDERELEQTLAICATLTLSTSIGDSTPPPNTTTNPLDSTTFVLQQSITSPLKTINTNMNTNTNEAIIEETQFHFGAAMNNKDKDKDKDKEKLKQTEIEIVNDDKNTQKTISNKQSTDDDIHHIAHIHHGPTQSLITLRNRGLVNGGLENNKHGHIEYCDEGVLSMNINDNESDIQSIGRFTVISPTKRGKNNNDIIRSSINVKEWKPISNATYERIKKPRESLILLKKKRLVNGGMQNFDFIDEEIEDNDNCDIFESDPEHRSLPTWLANSDEIEQFIIDNGNNRQHHHSKQETDVLD